MDHAGTFRRTASVFVGALALWAGAALAQVQVDFSPPSINIGIGERALVAVQVGSTTAAAFQIDLTFNPVYVEVLNPNEAYRGTIDPFAPLGNHPSCTTVRGTPTCTDPDWLLVSTSRTPLGTDTIDNATGLVRVAYGTHGAPAPPASAGALAMIEVLGVYNGTVTVNLGNVIVADNSEPPTSYPTSLGSLSVVVGTGIANQPPVLSPVGNQSLYEGQILSVPIASTDPDGDALTLSALGLPAFCSLTDNGDGSGNLSCAPAVGAAGTYPVTMRVSDDGGPVLVDDEGIVITVLATSCVDADADGYGDPGHVSCRLGTATDCNDANAAVNPAASEVCRNTLDDDCNGFADVGETLCQAPVCLLVTLGGAPGSDPTIGFQSVATCPAPGALARAVDVIWGDQTALNVQTGQVHLGPVRAVACADLDDVQLFDSQRPDDGKTDFILVRETGQLYYGVSSAAEPRTPDSGDCP